jgi:hypothetical protein
MMQGLEKLNPDSKSFGYNDEINAIKGPGSKKRREALREEYRAKYQEERAAMGDATYE